METRKFILVGEVSFQEKHSGFGQISSVEIVIPKGNELVVTGVMDVALNFQFSNGYEIVTTFDRLERDIESGALKQIGE